MVFSREIMHFTEEEIEDANQSIIYHRSTDSMGTVSQFFNRAKDLLSQGSRISHISRTARFNQLPTLTLPLC